MPGPYPSSANADDIVRDLAQYIRGKVILVTGVSPGGLRAHFVQALAKAQPKLLILAGRSEQKTQSTGKTISSANSAVAIKTLDIELSSQKSVRQAAAVVSDWDDVPAIDVLVNNAGIMARPYELSPEGIEMHLAANHVGPFLFTNLIMKKLLASSQPRIVNVASDGHRLSWMRWADYNFDVCRTQPKSSLMGKC